MATRKRPTRAKRARRRIKPAEAPNRLVMHYVTINEVYKAARAAGFSDEKAYWLSTDKDSYPDWIMPIDPNKTAIPRIDPNDEDED